MCKYVCNIEYEHQDIPLERKGMIIMIYMHSAFETKDISELASGNQGYDQLFVQYVKTGGQRFSN